MAPMMDSCPECGRPYNRNEVAKRRHAEIVRLWGEVKNMSHIARIVGLTHAGSVWHHLFGKCRCESEK